MATQTEEIPRQTEEIPGAVWHKHCHDFLGADVYTTRFPSLYGTDISISTFPPKTILTPGELLMNVGDFSDADPLLLRFEQHTNYNPQRVYAFPKSIADTKLSLSCCFEGDSSDWDANSAFFREGRLVALLTRALKTDKPQVPEHGIRPSDVNREKGLIKIYQEDVRNLARELLYYKGEGDPWQEFVDILNAESPSGKGLHDSYRDAIKEILE